MQTTNYCCEIIIVLIDRGENIVGKGENAGYQHFLLFPTTFQKASSSGLLKVGIVWERVNLLIIRGYIYDLNIKLCPLTSDIAQ